MNLLRWIVFFIFAYLILGVQLGMGSFVAYRGVSPDLLLILVIFISLNAPREQALLGSFILGALQDLIAVQPLGLFAFSYGLVSLLVVFTAESVRRKHVLTHLSFTFCGGVLLGMLLIVHDYFRPASPVQHLGPRVVLVMVIYTTMLAPVVIGLLQLMDWLFAFEQHGRRRD
jgi:rod shape-determining protein MreD